MSADRRISLNPRFFKELNKNRLFVNWNSILSLTSTDLISQRSLKNAQWTKKREIRLCNRGTLSKH